MRDDSFKKWDKINNMDENQISLLAEQMAHNVMKSMENEEEKRKPSEMLREKQQLAHPVVHNSENEERNLISTNENDRSLISRKTGKKKHRGMKIIVLILIMIGLLVIVHKKGGIDGVIHPNKCGDNLVWSVVDCTLYINGTGNMYDYEENSHFWSYSAPWLKQSISSVKFSNGVTSIATNAFYGMSGISNIELPDSIQTIGKNAFNGCAKLETIDLPDAVISIGQYAFQGTGLIELSFPDQLRCISKGCCKGCFSLKKIFIPNTISTIGDYAFSDCTKLKSIVFEGRKIPDTSENAFSNIDTEALFYNKMLVYKNTDITYRSHSFEEFVKESNGTGKSNGSGNQDQNDNVPGNNV